MTAAMLRAPDSSGSFSAPIDSRLLPGTYTVSSRDPDIAVAISHDDITRSFFTFAG